MAQISFTSIAPPLVIFAAILTVTLCVDDLKLSDGYREHRKLSLKRQDLAALKQILTEIDNDLSKVQKRWSDTCSIGAGMPGYNCRLDQLGENADMLDYLDSNLAPGKRAVLLRRPGQKRWSESCSIGAGMPGYNCRLDQLGENADMLEFLDSNLAPGKRSLEKMPKQHPVKVIKDLSRKRLGLRFLESLLNDKDGELEAKQKRNCRVNLGGHCQAETAFSLANQFRFLNSADSPGRRRRAADLVLKNSK